LNFYSNKIDKMNLVSQMAFDPSIPQQDQQQEEEGEYVNNQNQELIQPPPMTSNAPMLLSQLNMTPTPIIEPPQPPIQPTYEPPPPSPNYHNQQPEDQQDIL